MDTQRAASTLSPFNVRGCLRSSFFLFSFSSFFCLQLALCAISDVAASDPAVVVAVGPQLVFRAATVVFCGDVRVLRRDAAVCRDLQATPDPYIGTGADKGLVISASSLKFDGRVQPCGPTGPLETGVYHFEDGLYLSSATATITVCVQELASADFLQPASTTATPTTTTSTTTSTPLSPAALLVGGETNRRSVRLLFLDNLTQADLAPLDADYYGGGAGTVANGACIVLSRQGLRATLFHPATRSWTTPPQPQVRHGNGVAVLNDTVYAIAGGAPTTFAEKFRPLQDSSWTPIEPFVRSNNDLAAVGLPDGRIMVVGGQFGGRDVYVYSPADNSWSTGPELRVYRRNAAALLVDDFVYVLGGTSNGNNGIRDMERLRVAPQMSSSWEPLQPMRTGRQQLTVIPFNGTILALGGYPISSAVEEYSIAFDSWRSLAHVEGITDYGVTACIVHLPA